jgi:hypothetical protein
MRALTAQLRALGDAVNRTTRDNINYGGCGVYAAAVARRLIELGVQAEVVVPLPYGYDADGPKSVNDARNNLYNAEPGKEDWEHAGLRFSHCAVRFKHNGRWYMHDSRSTKPGRSMFGGEHGDSYDALPDGMTPDEMQLCADEASGWNDSFDRSLIPRVLDLVQQKLEGV